MLFPYQIGGIPLARYLGGSEDPAQFSLDLGWEAPVVSFAQTGGSLYQGPINRAIAKPTEAKIQGVVQARSGALAQELLSGLQSLGGRLYTPLIVFRYEDPQDEQHPMNVDWLIADALILSKSYPYSYAGEDQGNAGHLRLRLDISLNLMSPFRRLSPWFWEYRSYENRAQNPYEADGAYSPSIRFIHPKSFREVRDQHYFLRWQDSSTLLSPDYWDWAFSEGIYGGDAAGFSETYTVFYHSDPQRWASPPQVVYAFTNLLPYGSLSIEVQRSVGSFYGDDYTETSVLNLEQLDTDLSAKGFGGLFSSDIVYVGNVFPFPSYVVRDEVTLEGVIPDWDYEGLFPGELQTGPARIHFVPYLSSMQVAYYFAYGAF